MSTCDPIITVWTSGKQKKSAGLDALWAIATNNFFRHRLIPGALVTRRVMRDTK